jgi:glycosyltransferase involved in cell wall biosynthesis
LRFWPEQESFYSLDPAGAGGAIEMAIAQVVRNGNAGIQKVRTLYLCYFGLREPLTQTQVLPYLRELSRNWIATHLLTFEPGWPHSWSDEERAAWRERLLEVGIEWDALAYHKKPSALATLYDILVGTLTAVRLARREKIDVLHARAHIPLVMALLARRLCGTKVIFDVRGLVADEYVDAGIWRARGPVYRTIKWVERIGIARAEQIVVLTERMSAWLVEEMKADPAKIEVIPCCADFSRFNGKCAVAASETGAADRFEAVYAGSVTGLYLLEEIGRFFLALRKRRPNAYLRILTTSPAADASETLSNLGLGGEDYWVGAVPPSEMPDYLRRAKIGLSFRKPTFSQIATSPTKIPEYLASGIPVVSNAGIGDTDRALLDDRVGIVVKEFSHEAYDEAVGALLELLDDPDLAARCRRSAYERFDLESVGAERYRRLYQRIFESEARKPSTLPVGQ